RSRCTASVSMRPPSAPASTSCERGAGALAARRDVRRLPVEAGGLRHMLTWFRDLRLAWKLIVAPAFLILVLVIVGAHALYMHRTSQSIMHALMAGPVRQAGEP